MPATPAPLTNLPRPSASPWAPGALVGRYLLVAPIAQGGMAEIWRARQTGVKGFEKVVVVKRIGVDAAKGEALALKLATARDPTVCAGTAECATEFGARLGLRHVVSLQLAAFGSSFTLDAALLEVPSGKPLGVSMLSVKGDPELAPVAAALVESLPELVADARADGAIVNVTGGLSPPSLTAPVMPVKRKVALGAGAGALAVIGLGLGLGISADFQAARLWGNMSNLERAQGVVRARALGADISYGLGAGLVATAIVLWFTTSAQPPDAVTWRLVPTGREVVLQVNW